jgi:succinoglycan biosynthesis protein ExoU
MTVARADAPKVAVSAEESRRVVGRVVDLARGEVQTLAQVAVIIAARNAQDTIARAIESALDQPETLEVIVVDDASTDATANIARACDPSGRRVQVISFQENAGPSAARNAALKQARAPLVTILDADDFMLPGRLGELVKAMGGADVVADDLTLSLESAPLQLTGRLIGATSARRLTLEDFAYGNIARRGERRRELGFLKPLMRRAFLERHGLGYDPELRLGEDFVLYAQALAKGAEFRLTPAFGYVAVERDSSISGSHSTAALEAFHRAASALAKEASLDGRTRRALSAHARSVEKRLAHRQVLDVRREKGLAAALAWLVRRPALAPAVIGQTIRDKLRR